MKNKRDGGFSIIELLVVCAVIAIIATIAVPYLQKAVRATENGNMYATLRSVASTQASFISTNSRYARLNEINNIMSSSIGTPSGNDLIRGRFTIFMTPAVPTDDELRTTYTITASRSVPSEGVTYVYVLTESGLEPMFP
jgi:prepilin-type N-terminal cleavage/methylation domain-containing protein